MVSKELVIGALLIAVAVLGIALPLTYLSVTHKELRITSLGDLLRLSKIPVSILSSKELELIYSKYVNITKEGRLSIKCLNCVLVINNSLSNALSIKVFKSKSSLSSWLGVSEPKYEVRVGSDSVNVLVSNAVSVIELPTTSVHELSIEVANGVSKLLLSNINLNASLTLSNSVLKTDLRYLSKDGLRNQVSIHMSNSLAKLMIYCSDCRIKYLSRLANGLSRLYVDHEEVAKAVGSSTYVDKGFSESLRKLVISIEGSNSLAEVKVMRGGAD